MPIYEYDCTCGQFEVLRPFSESGTVTLCPCCGFVAQRKMSVPNLQTDTNFFATGKYDDRVCDSRDDLIKDRKDWQRRLDKKKLRVLDWSELNRPKKHVPKPCM